MNTSVRNAYLAGLLLVAVPLTIISAIQFAEMARGEDTAAVALLIATVPLVIVYCCVFLWRVGSLALRIVSLVVHLIFVIGVLLEITHSGFVQFAATDEVGVFAWLVSLMKVGYIVVFPWIIFVSLKSSNWPNKSLHSTASS